MTKHVAAAIALLAAPVAIASGCANQSANNPSTGTTTTSGSASNAQQLTTQLNTADGRHVANATIDFTSGYATVTVETAEAGILSPGFHGLHIPAVGKSDGDFTSAGEHFQASGHTGSPASGDLPPLLVRSDGSGKLVATSDSFTADELKGPQGSSIVLHQGATMDDTSSDPRLACGVLSPVSATSTSVSTSVSTSTVTTGATTTAVPPATVTETTPSSTAPTSTTSVSPSTSTSTVTVIQPPTIPPITIPAPPG
jgi:Cu-Zn family superoxide dismutase